MTRVAYERLFLRSLNRDRLLTGLTLSDALSALGDAKFAETKSGRQIVATSTNGHSIQFADPSRGELTPLALSEIISDLLDRYDAAVVEMGVSPTDAQVYACMLDRIVRVTSFRGRYTNLRA